uniref:Uncharacterized protein n=1 Tax=Meloidogyne enterolobii TaxID=390850 RepID=A0A6V7Y039_MELEN|nr:unnamed protein product [Meloidogyne enterolobii]
MLQKAFWFVELEFQVTVPKMMKYIVLDQMLSLLPFVPVVIKRTKV